MVDWMHMKKFLVLMYPTVAQEGKVKKRHVVVVGVVDAEFRLI